MPQEQGYDRRVGSASPAALPQASAAAFGAGIGAAVADVGDALARSREIDRRNVADAETADAAVKLADARQRLDAVRDEARAAPAAGAAGHEDAMAAAFDREVAGIADGITSTRGKRAVATQIAEYRAEFVGKEHGWQTVYRAKQSVSDLRTLNEKATARLYSSSDPGAYGQESKAWDDVVDGRSDIGADQREAVRREGHAALALAYGGRLEKENPAALIAAIGAGVFNDVLDAKQLESMRSGADAELRMAAAQARAQAAEQKTVLREQLATVRAALDTGAGRPQDWDKLAGQYEAIGDTSSAVTARARGSEQAAALDHRSDALPQIDQQIADLTAKESRGGLSPAQASLRTGLTTLRNQKAQRLGQQGGALQELQFSTGERIVPIDPGNPASLQARAAQARRASLRAGRATIEPFTETELPAMKDLMESGAGGRVQVLTTLAGLRDAQAIVGAARQVSGAGDGAFRTAARMLTYPAGQAVATAIVRGAEIRSKQPWSDRDTKMARDDFLKYYGGALRGGNLPADYVNDLLDGAMGFYASRSNGGAYDAGNFARAIEAVLGQNGGRGGVARTPQGIVIAPPTMTPDAMMARFARVDEAAYRAAANGRAPVWSDGSHVWTAQLRTMLPTMLADGRYGFRGSNGALLHDDQGGIYAVDVARLPAR